MVVVPPAAVAMAAVLADGRAAVAVEAAAAAVALALLLFVL